MATVVRVAPVELGSIDARGVYVAETRPVADVRLSAEVSGRISRVDVDLGDEVEAGQVLARIDDRVFSQAVREAGASVHQAEAAVKRAAVELGLAEQELHRARRLHEREVVTSSELEVVEGRHQSAEAALELARADEQQRRARLERARIDLANTRVLAPFGGTIAWRGVDQGALVSPGSQVFRVVDTRVVIVSFAAPEADVVRLSVGQEVRVDFEATGAAALSGTVGRVSPVVDPATRTVTVEVEMDREDRVRPGMFARVTATLDSKEGVPLVPAAALVRRQAEGDLDVREGVFVIRGETAHFVPVRPGIRDRASVEIVDGVAPGDSVVVAGHSELRDGGSVRLIRADGGSAAHPDGGGKGS